MGVGDTVGAQPASGSGVDRIGGTLWEPGGRSCVAATDPRVSPARRHAMSTTPWRGRPYLPGPQEGLALPLVWGEGLSSQSIWGQGLELSCLPLQTGRPYPPFFAGKLAIERHRTQLVVEIPVCLRARRTLRHARQMSNSDAQSSQPSPRARRRGDDLWPTATPRTTCTRTTMEMSEMTRKTSLVIQRGGSA